MKIQASTRLLSAVNPIDTELKRRINEKAKKSSTWRGGLNLAQMKGALERANLVLKRNLKAAGLKNLQLELERLKESKDSDKEISKAHEAALDHAVTQALFF